MTSTALVQAHPAALASFALDPSRLVDAFLAGRNERTLAAYRADLEAFRVFVGVATAGEASSRLLSGSHGEANATALAYKAYMADPRAPAATINRRLAALRSLVRLANTVGIVPVDAFGGEHPGTSLSAIRVDQAATASGPCLPRRRHSGGRRRIETWPASDLLHDLGLRPARPSASTSRTWTSPEAGSLFLVRHARRRSR